MIHAVFPSRKGLLPAVQALLNYLAEHVPQTAAFSGTGNSEANNHSIRLS